MIVYLDILEAASVFGENSTSQEAEAHRGWLVQSAR